MRAASFGVAGAVPLAAGDTPADRHTLVTQVGSIHHELAQRVEQLTRLTDGFHADTATVEAKYVTLWRGCASSLAQRSSCCRVLRP